MAVASGGIGCFSYGLLAVGFLFVGMALDNPYVYAHPEASQAQAEVALKITVPVVVGEFLILGFVLGRLNRRWWLKGPLIASWPLYFFLITSISYRYTLIEQIEALGVGAVLVTITIVGAFIARRWGWPRRDLRPTHKAAAPNNRRHDMP
jgi:hypothetical protein